MMMLSLVSETQLIQWQSHNKQVSHSDGNYFAKNHPGWITPAPLGIILRVDSWLLWTNDQLVLRKNPETKCEARQNCMNKRALELPL